MIEMIITVAQWIQQTLQGVLLGLALAFNASAPQAPLPAMAADLPVDVNAADLAFDARVRQAFPVGSSEAALLQTLKKDGFKIAPSRANAESSAGMERPNGCGSTVWSVYWHSDGAGLITDIRSLYGFRCL